ncbi:GerMN domain-containing protein [Kitasatospora sp. RG8]|uniref:LpqB family beta-propeller domain-containing protein n=1 Tax=Kitasatospora sp. RG8 TaxID=2820815 RepID=UPI001ADED9A3|nr:LpqB family beta-propeller domain-containing protein [Kitasatospora sp. RG8]MBP0454289.1 GerMN domain-containing protein [Kitasatospora sp. RG8]
MRRTSSTTEPRTAAVAGTVLVAVLAGGCAAMPDSGGIGKVELSQGTADKNLQVRVFPVGPVKGAKPEGLLNGFLDALTADESYDTARKYLTDEAAVHWNPDAGIQVLEANPTPRSNQTVTDTDTSFSIQVPGKVVAKVDDKHSYTFSGGQLDVDLPFTFVREKGGEWRIAKLPDGLIINQTNFRNSFRQVDRFFYAAQDPSAAGTTAVSAQDVLIADPVYLRRRIDTLTSAAKAVVSGPSDWLSPVVRTAFPTGATVDRVTVDEGRVAHVVLNGVELGNPTACRQMATQLFYTLADQGKGQVERLELKNPRGTGCQATSLDGPVSGPGALAGDAAARQYFQRAEDGVLMEARDTDGTAVRGPLGKPQPNKQPALGAIAVARDGERAAAISGNGHQLYSVALADGASTMPEPLLSTPPRPGDRSEDALASPSWDGRGNLWVVDRDPQNRRVLMVRGSKVYTVPVDGLDGQVVQDLKVSSDGVRIALVLRNPAGVRSLWLGLVVHGGTKEAPTVRITGLRGAAPLLTEVASVSWAETDQLLVLGKENGRIQQLHYISTDGSPSSEASLQGGESMATAEASEFRADSPAQVPPVLARRASDGQIFRLVNSQWREVNPNLRAASFIYPG